MAETEQKTPSAQLSARTIDGVRKGIIAEHAKKVKANWNTFRKIFPDISKNEIPTDDEVYNLTEELIDTGTHGDKEVPDLPELLAEKGMWTRAQIDTAAEEMGAAVKNNTGDMPFFKGATFMQALMGAIAGFFQWITGGFQESLGDCISNSIKGMTQQAIVSEAYERTQNLRFGSPEEKTALFDGFREQVQNTNLDNAPAVARPSLDDVEITSNSPQESVPVSAVTGGTAEQNIKGTYEKAATEFITKLETDGHITDENRPKTVLAKDILVREATAYTTANIDELRSIMAEPAEDVRSKKLNAFADAAMLQAVKKMAEEPAFKEDFKKISLKNINSMDELLSSGSGLSLKSILMFDGMRSKMQTTVVPAAIAANVPVDESVIKEDKKNGLKTQKIEAESAMKKISDGLYATAVSESHTALAAGVNKQLKEMAGMGVPKDLKAARESKLAFNETQQNGASRVMAKAIKQVVFAEENRGKRWDNEQDRLDLIPQVQDAVRKELLGNLQHGEKLDKPSDEGGKADKKVSHWYNPFSSSDEGFHFSTVNWVSGKSGVDSIVDGVANTLNKDTKLQTTLTEASAAYNKAKVDKARAEFMDDTPHSEPENPSVRTGSPLPSPRYPAPPPATTSPGAAAASASP